MKMLKFFLTVGTLALLVGCEVSVSHNQSMRRADVQAADSKIAPVEVWVDDGGAFTWNGWRFYVANIPLFVSHVKPAAVVVRGQPGTSFVQAVQLQEELEQAGVANVTIGASGG